MAITCIIPPPLKPGDVIGVAAPGGPFDTEAFERGIAVLREMGFQPFIPEDIHANQGYLAGPDRLRANVLMNLFMNPDVRAVICARGGYGTMRILPLLDFDAIRVHPKWLIGFSDITALLNTLPEQSGLACLHGPVVTTLGLADRLTVKSLGEALCNVPNMVLQPSEPVMIGQGRAQGILMGGNLATLCHLTGTPFQPDFAGSLLLLEDTNEPPYRMDRMLTQMKLAGCFDSVVGVLLGRFGESAVKDEVVRIFEECFGDAGIPVLGGFDIGHGGTNLALPIGVNAVLDADRGSLSFEPYSEA